MDRNPFTPSLSYLAALHIWPKSCSHVTMGVMWLWTWRNVLSSRHNTWTHKHTGCQFLTFPPFTCHLVTRRLWYLRDTRSSNSSPALESPQRHFNFCVVLNVTLEVNQSRRLKSERTFVWQTPFSPHMSSPACGTEEDNLSKLRSWEVYSDWAP